MENLNLMRIGLGIIVGVTYGIAAKADVIRLDEAGFPDHIDYNVAAAFEINSDPARVWVELTYTERVSPFSDRTPNEETKRVKVDNLTFDPASKEIVLSSSGENIVCARIVKRGFPIRYKRIEMTDSCGFHVEKDLKEVTRDDGFRTWKEKAWVITTGLRVNER